MQIVVETNNIINEQGLMQNGVAVDNIDKCRVLKIEVYKTKFAGIDVLKLKNINHIPVCININCGTTICIEPHGSTYILLSDLEHISCDAPYDITHKVLIHCVSDTANNGTILVPALTPTPMSKDIVIKTGIKYIHKPDINLYMDRILMKSVTPYNNVLYHIRDGIVSASSIEALDYMYGLHGMCIRPLKIKCTEDGIKFEFNDSLILSLNVNGKYHAVVLCTDTIPYPDIGYDLKLELLKFTIDSRHNLHGSTGIIIPYIDGVSVDRHMSRAIKFMDNDGTVVKGGVHSI